MTGLLVPPRDHAAMAQAIVRLLRTSRAARGGWATPGFARVQRAFTVERMVAETAAVYARVAGTPHAADTAHHACARLNPHAFIMPRWQSEKSYFDRIVRIEPRAATR